VSSAQAAFVPVAEGLFEVLPDGPRLIGSRCASCDTIYFPVALSCRNPGCAEKRIESALLPGRGSLLSYTIQRYQPPPLFRMDNWQPYAIGLIDLGAGVEVMGMLTGLEFDAIRIGMPLRMVIEALYTDPARGPVATYKFAPDTSGPAETGEAA
jgi:uncharacterized OB-fold protein